MNHSTNMLSIQINTKILLCKPWERESSIVYGY